MAMYNMLTIVSLLICIKVHFGITNFIDWNPKFANRADMKCPISKCNDTTISEGFRWTLDGCCACYAKPAWTIPHDQTEPLEIEYVKWNGYAILLKHNNSESSYQHIYHSDGYLTRIPINICDFKQRVVKMELRHNKILKIGDISCLLMLDTLDLSYNNIIFIGNKTFQGLKHLRLLKLTNNNLQILEPSAITGSFLNIFHANFSYNAMLTVELSNMISEHYFCRFDFSSNKIKEVINTNHFKIDPLKTYKGGIVELTGNNFTKFFDFQKIGITDIAILGKVFEYGFVLSDVKWNCDCHMEPYLELSELVTYCMHNIWKDNFNKTCWNPPEYRGRSIPDMVKEGNLDLFICNLTTTEKCSKNCHCFHQPKERRTVVNCTNAGLMELPRYIPDRNNITLILKNNSIEHFENRDYLKNVSVLDLSENNLESISPEAINSLPKGISISFENNNFKSIPRVLQTLDPCAIKFGTIALKCECTNIWIKDWLVNSRAERCSNSTMYMCEGDDGYTPVNEISRDVLCPVERSYLAVVIISALCALVIGISSFIYFFRFELYLMKRKIISRKIFNKVGLLHPLDAFVSFNDENTDIRSWALNYLSENLTTLGYRIFIPCRDLDFGGFKEQELLQKISSSKNFIIILSDDYKLSNTIWTEIEWKYIWHNYKSDVKRNIIIINFDQFETSDNMDPRLRAFIRLGYDIDFSNRDHSLIQQMANRLGPPRMYNE